MRHSIRKTDAERFDNSVCCCAAAGIIQKAGARAMSPLLIAILVPDHGRHVVPVRHLRHGGRHDPDRRPARDHAGAGRDDAARRHADGLERLARAAVVAARALERRRRLCRSAARSRCCVWSFTALRAEHAGRAAAARADAVPGAAGAERAISRIRKACVQGSDLRRRLHDADAAHRRRRPADRSVLPRRQARPPRDRRHQGGLPDLRPCARS